MTHSIQLPYTLILPYTLRIGAYGRIDNANLLIRIGLVCKVWREWIYSDQGPFLCLGKKIDEIRAKPGRNGTINELNKALLQAGKIFFKCIKNYQVSSPLEIQRFKEPVNYKNPYGEVALQKAIDAILKDINVDKLPLISYLIDQGADVNTTVFSPRWNGNSRLCTYLPYIFRQSNPENLWMCKTIADILLKRGLDINALGCDGSGVLHLYCQYDDDNGAILNWYIQNGGDLNLKSSMGKTPLQEIVTSGYRNCYRNSFRLAERIVSLGQSIDIPDPSGDFPLHQIAKDNWVKAQGNILINLILNTDPEQFFAKDASGCIPLWWAIKYNKKEIQSEFFSYITKNNVPLNLATQSHLLEAILEFVKDDYIDSWYSFDHFRQWSTKEIKCIDNDLSARFLNPLESLLNKLTSSEEDKLSLLSMQDKRGDTFFHRLAVICPHLINIASISHPAELFNMKNFNSEDVSAMQQKGMNTISLIKACCNDNVLKVESLLNKSVSLSIQDRDNHSILHLVISRRNNKSRHKILKMLLEKGVNPNHRDLQGNTPLYYLDPFWEKNMIILLENSGGHL